MWQTELTCVPQGSVEIWQIEHTCFLKTPFRVPSISSQIKIRSSVLFRAGCSELWYQVWQSLLALYSGREGHTLSLLLNWTQCLRCTRPLMCLIHELIRAAIWSIPYVCRFFASLAVVNVGRTHRWAYSLWRSYNYTGFHVFSIVWACCWGILPAGTSGAAFSLEVAEYFVLHGVANSSNY